MSPLGPKVIPPAPEPKPEWEQTAKPGIWVNTATGMKRTWFEANEAASPPPPPETD